MELSWVEVAVYSVIYLVTVVFGYIIAKRRHRWVAWVLPIVFPGLGFIMALSLRKSCGYCGGYYRPGSEVCPICGCPDKSAKDREDDEDEA